MPWFRLGFYPSGTEGETYTASKIQLELGSTATAYTPYVSDFTASKVTRYGKNLFDMNLIDVIGLNDLGSYMVDYADAGLDHYTEVLENGYIVQGGHKSAAGGGSVAHSNGWFTPGKNKAYYKKIGCYVPAGATITWSYDVTLLERVYYPNDDYPFVFRSHNVTKNNLNPAKEGIRLTLNEKKHIVVTGVNPYSGILCPQFTLNACKLKIENIQLEINDTDTGYTPFCDSNNLFDVSSVTGCYVRTTGEAYSSGGSVEDSTLIAHCGTGAKDLTWGTSTMHLKKGSYDIITDCYYTAAEGTTINTFNIRMGVGNATNLFSGYANYTNNYITSLNKWRRLCCRINVSEEGDYNIVLQPTSSKTDLEIKFKNIQVRRCRINSYDVVNSESALSEQLRLEPLYPMAGKASNIDRLCPATVLSTDSDSTVVSEATGVYKHILPSEGKNCFTKIWNPISEEV